MVSRPAVTKRLLAQVGCSGLAGEELRCRQASVPVLSQLPRQVLPCGAWPGPGLPHFWAQFTRRPRFVMHPPPPPAYQSSHCTSISRRCVHPAPLIAASNMASPTTRRRSREHIESEQEADSTRFARDASPTTPDGSKRMRLRGGRGHHSHLDMQDGDEEEAAIDDDSRATNGFATNGASATDFSPGSIVRVLLKNFVTYEKAEFFPGPNLNMVIGPNGTGKSSLVCAICLGLGYPASVLGRATSFGEFVKHGKENATVEIELQKRSQDRANYIVKLKINREENTRQFWYNGQLTTHKKIHILTAKLRIQIDNLCQFLPQEKVAEFAGLNPVELLGKTLQAVAPQKMIDQQAQLKEWFDVQKQMQRAFDTDAERLRSWQTRQQGLQADVDRLRERDQIKAAVAELEDLRLVVDYDQKKDAHRRLKEQKKRAQDHLKQLEERHQPSLEDVNKKQTYKTRIEAVLRARIQQGKDLGQSADDALEAVENIVTDIQNKENERAAADASFSKKKKDLGALRSQMTILEAQTKTNPHPNFNAAEYNHKIVCSLPRMACAHATDIPQSENRIES